ncbi:MAG: HAMP domain-containing sensor histidine kinase [Candidatus Omnitrophica bacterium]|nr:HAMP domain-containing sensor histidine kinase [Candidatus Omnitrophota bacterium]
MKINHILKTILYKYYFILALALVCFIGFLDYITGWELQFFIFYLLPIGIIVWFGGLFLGILVSLISIFTWYSIDIFTRHQHASVYIFIWNGGIRFIVFVTVAFFIFKIRSYQKTYKDFVDFIIHDLRVPLSTISAAVKNLEDFTSLDKTQKEILTICKIASQRGITLVNSILDFSRLESKKMPLDIKNINLDAGITSAIEMVSVYANNQKVKLEKHLESLPKDFYTDYSLLLRILVNLLSNAIKASANGCIVSICVTGVEGNVIFNVIDEGKGFPRLATSRLFRKFNQFHEKEKDGMLGSGLGLVFCKLAIEELGGSIKIESQENKGTKVTFSIPNKNFPRSVTCP